MAVRDEAATQIQSVHRGRSARKGYAERQAEAEEAVARRQAATRIQAAQRGRQGPAYIAPLRHITDTHLQPSFLELNGIP